MANNQILKDDIAAVIKANGNNEITGDLLQDALISIINQFGSGAVFLGFAIPATVPVNADIVGFYIALTNGVYPNFDGYEIKNNDVVVFDNKSGAYIGRVVLSITDISKRYATKSDVSRKINSSSSNNFNKETATLGAYINQANGGIIQNADWWYSDFIRIEPGIKYTTMGYYAYFNESQSYISGGVDTDGGLTTPAGVAYVKVSQPNADATTLDKYTLREYEVVNLIDNSKDTPGFYINQSTGGLIANASWRYSDYTKVSPFQKFHDLGYYAFYDANKVFINGGLNDGQAGPNVRYVRASRPIVDPLDIIPYNYVGAYEPYYVIDKNLISPYLLESLKNVNLFNKNTATLGFFVNQVDGQLIPNNDWYTSDFIPVEEGRKYTNLGYYAFYDKNYEYVFGGLNQSGGVLAQPGSVYLRGSITIDIPIDQYQIEEGEVSTSYQEPAFVLDAANVRGLERFFGKKDDVKYNEIIVRAGGNIGVDCDFTDIKSALDSITDNSKSNRYFVRVKNGTYDISNESYIYLGLKNYVEIVGQSKSGVIVINRHPTFVNDAACFDSAFYSDYIEYAVIRNMTCISFNGKSPIHFDSGYDKIRSGGSVYCIDLDLINENVFGSTHYQNGVACGLRDGQRIVCQNVNSNGQLWVHNSSALRPETGCYFELYNCRFPKTMIADIYCYGKDVFIMRNCKTLFIDFNTSDPLNQRRPYTEYSWIANMEGNEIGYIMGTNYLHGDSRFGTWDEAFGGKWGISDSSIHMYVKNNTNAAISRGDILSVDVPVGEISVKPRLVNEEMYGQSLDNIPAGGYGTIQYKGVLFINSFGTINVGDYVLLDNLNRVIPGTPTNNIGISLDAVSGTSIARIKLK